MMLAKRQSKSLFFAVFIVGFASFMIFSYIMTVVLGKTYPDGSFLFYPWDRYKDFFAINKDISNWDPYYNWLTNYPPLILVLAYPFACCADYSGYDIYTLQNAINDSAARTSLWVLVGIYVGIVAVTVIIFGTKSSLKMRKTASKYEPIGLSIVFSVAMAVVMVLSAPSLFMIDRGNYLMISVIFLLLWAVFEDSGRETPAAVFLGLCAAVKIYPVLIILFYLLVKKYKQFFIAVAVAAVTTIVPFLTFKHDIISNAKGFIGGLVSFSASNQQIVEMNYGYFNVGLTGLISYLIYYTPIGSIVFALGRRKLWFGIGALLVIICMLLLRKEKALWKRVYILTVLMIYLTPNSYLYNSSYLIAPVVVMLLSQDDENNKFVKSDVVYALVSALLLVPKAYYYVDYKCRVGVNVLIDGLLYLFILLYFIVETMVRRKKQKAS